MTVQIVKRRKPKTPVKKPEAGVTRQRLVGTLKLNFASLAPRK